MSLSDSIDQIVGDMEVVHKIRSDVLIGGLLSSYARTRVDMDTDSVLQELSEIGMEVSFDADAFPLEGVGGLSTARNIHLKLNALRDRITAISGSSRRSLVKVRKIHRIAHLYVRQNPLLGSMTVNLANAVSDVVLREMVEDMEDMKSVSEAAKEALGSVDKKTSALEAWFSLHKQYVFMVGRSKGPRGEEDTYDTASKSTKSRRLGRNK